MYIFFYYKSDGQVKFWSETKQVSDLEEKKLNVSQADFDLLKANWHPFIKNNKLELEKPAHIIKQEKENTLSLVKNKLSKIADGNTKDTLNELLKIISI